MAEKQSDQTEKPTEKRIRDARKKGQVHRSQDLSRTLGLLVWIIAFAVGGGFLIEQVLWFSAFAWSDLDKLTPHGVLALVFEAGRATLLATIPFVVAGALAGLLSERAQVGSIFSTEKLVPKLEVLNPAEGIKKLISVDKLFDAGKAALKALIVVWTVYLVLYDALPDYLQLFQATVSAVIPTLWRSVLIIAGFVLFAFFFISLLDVVYQRHSYTKNLMMSQRDIRQEHKEQNGDPAIKNQRKQLHQQWSQQSTLGGVSQANVLVTNPIHFAVALRYEPGETELPIVVAKGRDHLAIEMRHRAEDDGIPVMENIPLARGLFADVEVDHYITTEYFEMVAAVLRWAHDVRTQAERIDEESPESPDAIN